ncbi:hypothetical protein PFISCL1PPCAC_20662, partial [Pristionchus fissidentatus]
IFSTSHTISSNDYIKAFVARFGAVVVEIPVDRKFFFYKSGVYRPVCSNIIGYQPAVVIGYETTETKDIWIVRNSFGIDWGINGDVQIERVSDGATECSTFSYAFAFYHI